MTNDFGGRREGISSECCNYGNSDLLGSGSMKSFETKDPRARTRYNYLSRRRNKCCLDSGL